MATANSSAAAAYESPRSALAGAARLQASVFQHAHAAADDHEEDRNPAGDDGERRQPAGDEVERRQREEVEGDRPAEHRIDGRRDGGAASVPVERERRPLGHHAEARHHRDEDRGGERDEPQHGLDRQDQRLAVDDDVAARGQPEVVRLERPERSVERREGDERGAEEDRALQVQRLPEDVAVAEGRKPERLDVVGQRRAGAQERRRRAAAATARRPRRR